MRLLALLPAAGLAAMAFAAGAQPAPAPATAGFYAGCLSESAAARTYDRSGRYLRFTCYGPAAEAFYDRLDAYATPRGWVRATADRTYRFTAEIKNDDDGGGLDRCWKMHASAADAPAHGCLLVFPAGAFLDD